MRPYLALLMYKLRMLFEKSKAPLATDAASSTLQTDVIALLDSVLDEYSADHSIIFKDESERKKYLFGSLGAVEKGWKKSRSCMVPSCTHKSIARSHSVPRAMLSDRVADAGHVLTPALDRNQNGRLVVQKIGISDASTFPGFCAIHERLFEDFENAKKLSSERDVLLQTYRTACRELFRTNFLMQHTNDVISIFERLRDERLTDRFRNRLKAAGLGNVEVQQIKVSSDPLMEPWRNRLQELKESHSYYANELVPGLEEAVFGGDESNITSLAIDIDLELPVGMSGMASPNEALGGQSTLLNTVFGVLPHTGGILVFMAALAKDRAALQAYYDRWMENGLTLLSMIESWMINGTDQWYLKPSVWEKLGMERQEAILQSITDCKQSIYEETELSIFDDVRRDLLAAFESEHGGRSDSSYVAFIAGQKAKMTD